MNVARLGRWKSKAYRSDLTRLGGGGDGDGDGGGRTRRRGRRATVFGDD